MEDGRAKQILLIAPTLIGETLAHKIKADNNKLKASIKKEDLEVPPDLIIFYLESVQLPNQIKIEILRLKENWVNKPVLVIIPDNSKLNKSELLDFSTEGILQNPSFSSLTESIDILLSGGRVIKLNDTYIKKNIESTSPYGLGQWLLISGVTQIDNELNNIELFLRQKPENPFVYLILLGKRRELRSSRKLLYLLWGPLKSSYENENSKIKNKYYPTKSYLTEITIKDKTPSTIWIQINKRIKDLLSEELTNTTGELLGLSALSRHNQKALFFALLNQLDIVLKNLNSIKDKQNYHKMWETYNKEIRKQALIDITNSYTRLLKDGRNISLVDHLLKEADFESNDNELISIKSILDPLLIDKPISVDGLLLTIDDPRSILHLEMLICNWIIRTSELISEEIISICADWPELRKFFLNANLVSTREIERHRNLMNTKSQIQFIFKTPIRLYESKRLIYIIDKNKIKANLITEPRDEELKELNWIQKQVTLIVEIRDALAPQLQVIVKYIGDLIVVVLTKIIGRGIGLIGKGIAQGMGRGLSKG